MGWRQGQGHPGTGQIPAPHADVPMCTYPLSGACTQTPLSPHPTVGFGARIPGSCSGWPMSPYAVVARGSGGREPLTMASGPPWQLGHAEVGAPRQEWGGTGQSWGHVAVWEQRAWGGAGMGGGARGGMQWASSPTRTRAMQEGRASVNENWHSFPQTVCPDSWGSCTGVSPLQIQRGGVITSM